MALIIVGLFGKEKNIHFRCKGLNVGYFHVAFSSLHSVGSKDVRSQLPSTYVPNPCMKSPDLSPKSERSVMKW